MAEDKSVPIKRIVDVVILVAGWIGNVIYNVSRNLVFDVIPII